MNAAWAAGLLWIGGCMVRGSGEAGAPWYDEPPSITDVRWSCSLDEASWTIEVTTDAWSDGGTLWMARDLDRVERFTLRSTGADPQGGPDRLRTTLSVVADPRDAEDGNTTSFACTATVEASIAFRAVVLQPGTGAVSDCCDFGSELGLFDDSDEVPPCDRDWTAADTGG
ncbi:MAG: hypothetical protein JXB39_04405 [Deltaproteobacteria bacterium]|nr:hypothetical protein [Deltaproteobacteria bacterium]